MRTSVSSFSFRNNILRVKSYINSFSHSFASFFSFFLYVFTTLCFQFFAPEFNVVARFRNHLFLYQSIRSNKSKSSITCNIQILDYRIKFVSFKGHTTCHVWWTVTILSVLLLLQYEVSQKKNSGATNLLLCFLAAWSYICDFSSDS